MEQFQSTINSLISYPAYNEVHNLRLFIKAIERNMNNSININNTINKERKSKGVAIKLMQINGLKKIIDNPNSSNKYFIRFFINIFNFQNKKFVGNTYRSPNIPIQINDRGYIQEINLEPLYAYVLTENEYCIVQIIFVETNENEDILSQTCEGWTFFKLYKNISGDPNDHPPEQLPTNSSVLYYGTPKLLLFEESSKLIKIEGSKLSYECFNYPQLEKINFLLPDFIVIGKGEPLPGLVLRYLPEDPDFNEEIKIVNFENIYLKNVKITFSPHLEDKIINQTNDYYRKKYNNFDNANSCYIKERRLKCGINNTWCFINLNGLENSISLEKTNSNTLQFKGVLEMDKFFIDQQASCALILELNYTINTPIQGKEETLNIIIGYFIFVPQIINMDNNFRESHFITGPGETIYGEELWDPGDFEDRMIKINFIVSKDKTEIEFNVPENKVIDNTQILQRNIATQENKIIIQNNIDEERERELRRLMDENKRKDLEIESLKKTLQSLSNAPIIQFKSEQEQIPTQTIPLKAAQNTIPSQNIETNKETTEIYKETKTEIKYIPVPMGVVSESRIDPNEFKEFQEFQDYKRNKDLYRSYESMSKNMEDDFTKSKIVYEKRQKDISLRDRADLISKGILELDVEEPNEKIVEFTLDKEIKGGELASLITFQFLAFKPSKTTKNLNEIPDKLQFYFDFFNSQDLVSPVCIVNKPDSDLKYYNNLLSLKKEGSEFSADDEDRKVTNIIKYDPSVQTLIDFRDFIRYLLTKKMPIKVMDVDKNFCIGFIKVPLKDLIRQGKHQTYQTKEYEIYDNKFNMKGYVQLLLKNEGLNTLKNFEYNPQALRYVDSKIGYNYVTKKKKVVAKPINMSKISQEEKERMGEILLKKRPNDMLYNSQMNQYRQMRMEPEVEKKVRVLRYFNTKDDISKKMNIEEEKLNEIRQRKLNDERYFQQLQMAEQLRDAQRGNVIRQVTQENHRNQLEICLISGQPHYFNYIVTNPSSREETFHVIITKITNEYENNNYINNNEIFDETVSLVKSNDEWENLVRNEGFIKPNDFNIISGDNYLQIASNESIPLLFKLLSFEKTELEKKYNVFISKTNDQPLYTLTITIKYVFPIIDHIFQFYSPSNSNLNLPLVNPFKRNQTKSLQLAENYYCSDSHVILKVDSSINFYFNYEIKEEGFFHLFYLFFYLEQTKTRLYTTWKIEIKSTELITLSTNLGRKLTTPLYINNTSDNEEKILQLFSNSPTIYFPNDNGNKFKLAINETAEVSMVLYPKNQYENEVIVNCVNTAKREAFKTWLVNINTSKPEIDATVEVICIIGSITNIKYEYVNRLNNFVLLKFDSENEELLDIIDKQLPFNANETKYVNMSIPAQMKAGYADIMVFVYDDEEKISQTILFKLEYRAS